MRARHSLGAETWQEIVLMFSNQIDESFRMHFEAFFEQKNMFRHNSIFAGRSNGFFQYSFAFSENTEGQEEIDVILLVIPEFCVRRSKLDKERKHGLSIKDVILLEKLDVCTVVTDKSDIDEIMGRYLQILQKYYDKYFSFDSITECAEKILDYIAVSPMYTNRMYPKLAEIDFVDICYYYLKESGFEKCEKFLMDLVSRYRTVLYDKMKYDNMSGSNDNFSKDEHRKFDKMFINYSSISTFLESLLAHNDSYFMAVAEKFRNSKLESKKIIEELICDT